MILNHCRTVLVPIPHAFEFIGFRSELFGKRASRRRTLPELGEPTPCQCANEND